MLRSLLQVGLLSLALTQGTVGSSPVLAGQQPATPPWTELAYAKNYLWLKASTSLSLSPVTAESVADKWLSPEGVKPVFPEGDTLWQLVVQSQLGNGGEQVSIWMDPDTLQVYQRSRLSEGKQRRMKQYRLLEQGIYRVRREPLDAERGLSPDLWSKSSAMQRPFPPALTAVQPLLSPYALLVAVSTGPLRKPGDSWTQYLYTDVDYLRVEMVVTGVAEVAVDYRLLSGNTTREVKGPVAALVVSLQVRPVGAAPEDAFELMGLTGPVSILLDPVTGLPLQIRGSAPRMGETAIDLVRAAIPDRRATLP
ncbi:hypothetical protein [Porticoccus sp.]